MNRNYGSPKIRDIIDMMSGLSNSIKLNTKVTIYVMEFPNCDDAFSHIKKIGGKYVMRSLYVRIDTPENLLGGCEDLRKYCLYSPREAEEFGYSFFGKTDYILPERVMNSILAVNGYNQYESVDQYAYMLEDMCYDDMIDDVDMDEPDAPHPVYIHYGSDHFDPKKNYPIRNNSFVLVKPKGGLWASRVNATYGWKDCCERKHWYLDGFGTSFRFTIRDGANVAIINNLYDLKKLPMRAGCKFDDSEERRSLGFSTDLYWIDFEKCLENGIDAIEICVYGDEYQNGDTDGISIHYALYGWDCDSIVILNPDIVKQI